MSIGNDETLNAVVCKDFDQFRRRAAGVQLAREFARLRASRLTFDETVSVKRGITDYVTAFQRGVGNDCWQFVSELLRVDAEKEQPPSANLAIQDAKFKKLLEGTIISDDVLLNSLNSHRCRVHRNELARINCNQTVTVLYNFAVNQRGLAVDEPPNLVEGIGLGDDDKRQGKLPQPPTDGYGNVPGDPEPYGQLPERRAIKYEKLPPTGAPARSTDDVDSFNVEPREIVMSSRSRVAETVAAAAHIGHGVAVLASSNVQAAATGLIAQRAFAAGRFITEYEGDVVNRRRADDMRRTVPRERIHVLRAGVWFVVGFGALDARLVGRGGGSFAASTLDVCKSLREGREVACSNAETNAELVLLNDAENAASSDDEYDVTRVHLMLVATRDIAPNEEILLDVLRLGYYMSAEPSRPTTTTIVVAVQ